MDARNAMPDVDGAEGAGVHDGRDDAVEREVEAVLARDLPDVDLLELTVLGRSGTLRLVVDHPDGVDHGVCADVTHVLGSAGLLERFGIEVFSPGPEPPLRTAAHFARALGRRVKLEVEDPAAPRGRRTRTGKLVAADGPALTIEGEDRQEAVAIDLSAVRRARIAEPTAPGGSTG